MSVDYWLRRIAKIDKIVYNNGKKFIFFKKLTLKGVHNEKEKV